MGGSVAGYTMTIGGEAVAAAGTFGVVNPATGEVAERAPDATREQLDAAMDAAHAARAGWRADEQA
ncbi:aldehyde dehydrogenase family protein, partial [Actinomadura logoneensis]